jgi:hypothetical protein
MEYSSILSNPSLSIANISVGISVTVESPPEYPAYYSSQSVTMSTANTSQCSDRLQAVWQVNLFFAINIFGHAATVHLWSGDGTSTAIRSMFWMIMCPIRAGLSSFHHLLTFFHRLGRKRCRDIFSPTSIQDSIISGAVAIIVPPRFQHLIKGVWDRPELHHLYQTTYQKCVFTSGLPCTPTHPLRPHVFTLPPNSTAHLTGVHYPSSGVAQALFGLLQLGYGAYQVYTEYATSSINRGLSSPYIVAVPYLFMSAVNLTANALVRPYTHIIVLTPKEYDFELDNREDNTPKCRRVVSLTSVRHKPSTVDVEAVSPERKTQANFINWLSLNYPDISPDFSYNSGKSWKKTYIVTPTLSFLVSSAIILGLTRCKITYSVSAGVLLLWIYAGAGVELVNTVMMNLRPGLDRVKFYRNISDGFIAVVAGGAFFGGAGVAGWQMYEILRCQAT